jgi:competence protein ComEA
MKKMNMFLVLLVALTIAMPASLTFAAAKTTTENAVTLTEKVNINTSTEEALVTVPGIGPKTAQNINAYKKQNGNFNTVDGLLNVKGIGEKSLKKMKPYLTI